MEESLRLYTGFTIWQSDAKHRGVATGSRNAKPSVSGSHCKRLEDLPRGTKERSLLTTSQ